MSAPVDVAIAALPGWEEWSAGGITKAVGKGALDGYTLFYCAVHQHPKPKATGCDCKDCEPVDALVALRLALARTDTARGNAKFTPGAAGTEMTITCRDYDKLRAALAKVSP